MFSSEALPKKRNYSGACVACNDVAGDKIKKKREQEISWFYVLKFYG